MPSVRMLVLSVVLLTGNPVYAQFQPPIGPISQQVNFSSASSLTHGPYTLTRQVLQNPDRIRVTVNRPGSLSDYVFVESLPFGGGTTVIVDYSFIGSDGLVMHVSRTDTVNSQQRLFLVRLNTTPQATEVAIYNRTQFVTEQPNPQFFRNGNGSVFFTPFVLRDAAISDVFELDVYRADTGAHLCGMPPQNRDLSDAFRAEIVDNDGNGVSDHVRITRDRQTFTDIVVSCPLPAANLVATPQPLSFSPPIPNNATDTRIVTLSNPGTDSIQVSAISASAHFAPVNFTPFTINRGDPDVQVIIRFTPNGQNGPFNNESLTITRTPAVGASAIACTGSATTPVPDITLIPSSHNFGTVNVGNNPTRQFTVRNDGTLALNISAFTGPGSPVFTVTQPLPPLPLNLAPNAAANFTIRFRPDQDILFQDSVTIDSNDPDEGRVVVPLSGRGHIPVARFVLDPALTQLTYGDVEVGYRFGKGVRIQNQGDAPLTFSVETLGDPRFSVSTTPDVPGSGVRGPINMTVPASNLSPPFPALVLRVTFDAAMPPGGPYNGTLRIGNINDPSVSSPRDIGLSGSVVQGKTLDVVLSLDRSGSMSESAGLDTKATSVRRASKLFMDLMRPNVGDRAALVQFNTQADTLQAITPLTLSQPPVAGDTVPAIKQRIDSNLQPQGNTSIAAGLLAAFDQLTDPNRDVRSVFVVSDGKENTPATLPNGQQVKLEEIVPPASIAVHSLGIGRGGANGNIDQVNLERIATLSVGGSSMLSGDVAGLSIFAIEKFFLQAATTILGQQTALDPVYRIEPGQSQSTQVELIPADRDVTFSVLFQQGTLPFRVIAPDGTIYPSASPPNGFGQHLQQSDYAHILKLRLPTAEPQRYGGIWRLEVVHNGKRLLTKRGEHSTVEETNAIDYAVAVAVGSNLRLLGLLSPGPTYVGDSIHVTAFLNEEGVPVKGAQLDVTVTLPDFVNTRQVMLFDDGQHNDNQANDGEYAGTFTYTVAPGPYSFLIHAVGASARGGIFTRETNLGREVLGRPLLPGDGGGGGGGGLSDACCSAIVRLLRWLLIVAVLAVLVAIWCCRRKHG